MGNEVSDFTITWPVTSSAQFSDGSSTGIPRNDDCMIGSFQSHVVDDVTPATPLIGRFVEAVLPANQEKGFAHAPDRRNAVLNALEAMELLAASLPFIDSDVTDEDAPDWPSSPEINRLMSSPLCRSQPAPPHCSTPLTGKVVLS